MAETTNNMHNPSELFGQASRTFEAALKQGIKVQEESAKWFSDLMAQFASPQKWQQRTQTVVDEAISTTQKNIDEAIQLMNKNAKSSLDLLQKAIDIRQAETPSDAQANTREWWDAVLSTLRTNTEAVVESNTRIVRSWAELAKKLDGGLMGEMVDQANKMAQQAGRQYREATEKVVEAAAAH